MRIILFSTLILGGFLTASAQDTQAQKPTPPQLISRTAQQAKAKVCDPWDKNEKVDTFCGFLRYNYSTLQKVCGLAPTKSWLPWTWFRDTDPIKAIPSRVLASMVSTEQPAEKTYVLLEDTTSLSRLMTYVAKDDLVSDSLLSDKVMSTIESPAGVGNNLQFDPTLDPEIMLVSGSGTVVHTLSCSDVWSAMVNSGVAFSMAKAAAKISAEDDTSTTYKLVYGLFESPMAYMSQSHPETYYFEALDWYLRAKGQGNQIDPAKGPFYIKAVRGIAIYSTLKRETTTTGSGSASAGFASPLFSIDASASDNATSKGELKSQVFHILLGDASSSSLPTPNDTATYLNKTTVRPMAALAFDKGDLTMSVGIEGMPHSLCQQGIWQIATGDAHRIFRITNLVYHRPGDPVTQNSVRTRSQCEFQLAVKDDPTITSDFTGTLSSTLDLQTKPALGIPFLVTYSLPTPSLLALDAPSSTGNEGDWDFQILSGTGIDKSADPDASQVTVSCPGSDGKTLSAVNTATTDATFLSLFKNARGNYLKIHALLPSNQIAKNCLLSGRVILAAQNGPKIYVQIQGSQSSSSSAVAKAGN